MNRLITGRPLNQTTKLGRMIAASGYRLYQVAAMVPCDPGVLTHCINGSERGEKLMYRERYERLAVILECDVIDIIEDNHPLYQHMMELEYG